MKIKKCSKCGEEKELSEFYFRKDSNSYRNDCIECIQLNRKKYYLDHKKQIVLKIENYQKENKDYIKQKCKNNYLINRDKIIKQSKKWYENHKEEKKEYDKRYRIKNKERISKKDVKRKLKARRENIQIKVKDNLSRRISLALHGLNKSLSTIFLIGCDIDYLIYHIQEQFTKGMNWDNYGKWHIDHIKPCAKFDLSKESEQYKCFNFKNLQPLWAIDNLRKGNTYIDKIIVIAK